MQPLTVFYKEFISKTEWDPDDLNALHFTANVRFEPTKSGEFTEIWDGSFNLRVGSTTVRLHSLEDDIELIHLENKLTLLKETIEKFIVLYSKRAGNKYKKEINHRVWLNAAELKSRFTGYCSYNLDADGGGRLSISDCHRSIIIWLMPYWSDGVFYPSQNETLIDDISNAVTKSINKIKELRNLNLKAKES